MRFRNEKAVRLSFFVVLMLVNHYANRTLIVSYTKDYT